MNILLVSKRFGHSRCLELGSKWLLASLVLGVAVPLATLYTGYWIGKERGAQAVLSSGLQDEMDEQRATIEDAKRLARENLNALTLRLGQMQAHVIRLDALGQRLTRIAGLDKGEFDFNPQPAQGGPESGVEQELVVVPVLVAFVVLVEVRV